MPTKVILCDDDIKFTHMAKEFLNSFEDIDVVGVANNGNTVLDLIKQHSPDVLVLDILMPYLDGIGVLERLPVASRGDLKVIVASAFGSENLANKATKLGVDFFIMKPLQLESLLYRIRDCANRGRATKQSKNDINSYMLFFGLPVNSLGFKYIKTAVELISSSVGRLSITKEIYPHIAFMYNTTPLCVEKAIRNSISKAFIKQPQVFRETFKKQTKPSNYEFISYIAV